MDKKFPKQIPVFPLSGVIYFPKTNLPLNIFEDRYLDLVNDCFRSNKLMGMVQSKKENNLVYKVGCLGKISDYQETSDGRVLINLTGITRFEITKEITNQKILNHIIYKKSFCVNDFINEYNSYKGNAYGLANTLMQTAFLRPKLKSSKVKNLFFTGQLTVPGPGVPPAIVSGKLVADLIKKTN